MKTGGFDPDHTGEQRAVAVLDLLPQILQLLPGPQATLVPFFTQCDRITYIWQNNVLLLSREKLGESNQTNVPCISWVSTSF